MLIGAFVPLSWKQLDETCGIIIGFFFFFLLLWSHSNSWQWNNSEIPGDLSPSVRPKEVRNRAVFLLICLEPIIIIVSFEIARG